MWSKKLLHIIITFLVLYKGTTKSDVAKNESVSPETVLLQDDENEDILNDTIDTVLQLADDGKYEKDTKGVKDYQMGRWNGRYGGVQPWNAGSWTQWGGGQWRGGQTNGGGGQNVGHRLNGGYITNNGGGSYWEGATGNGGGSSFGGSYEGRQGGGGNSNGGGFSVNVGYSGTHGGGGGRTGARFNGGFGNGGGRWHGNWARWRHGGSNSYGNWNNAGFGVNFGHGIRYGGRGAGRGGRRQRQRWHYGGGYRNNGGYRGRHRSGNTEYGGGIQEQGFGMGSNGGGGGFTTNVGYGGSNIETMRSRWKNRNGGGNVGGKSGCIREDGGWFVIRHSSARCVWPNDGMARSGTKIVLGTTECANQNYVFVWTAKRSIKHVISGMCIGLKGKNLVLQNGCDRGVNLRFKYIKRKKRLMVSRKRWTVQATESESGVGGVALVAMKRVSKSAQAKFTFESAMKLGIKFSFTLGLSGGFEGQNMGGGGVAGGMAGGKSEGMGVGGTSWGMSGGVGASGGVSEGMGVAGGMSGGVNGGGGAMSAGAMSGGMGGAGGASGGMSESVSGGGGAMSAGASGGMSGGMGNAEGASGGMSWGMGGAEGAASGMPWGGSAGGAMFVIRHKLSGMCIYPKFNDGEKPKAIPLVLDEKCNDGMAVFQWTDKRSIRSVAFKGYYIHTMKNRLILRQINFKRSLAFTFDSETLKFEIKGRYVQPMKGGENVVAGMRVVTRKGQFKSWMAFQFVGATASGGMTGQGIVMSFGGTSGGFARAEEAFVIKHLSTGLCLYPKDGKRANNVEIVLARKCEDRKAIFAWTGKHSLQSIAFNGFCIHPMNGSPNPSDGTNLVLFKLCDEKRLEFMYNRDAKGLWLKLSKKYVQPQREDASVGTGIVVRSLGEGTSVAAWMKFEFIGVSAYGTMSNTKIRLGGNGRMKGNAGSHRLIKFGGMNSPNNGGRGFQVQLGTGKNAMKGRGGGHIQMGGNSGTPGGGGGRNFQIQWSGGNGAMQGHGGGGGFSMSSTGGGRWQTGGGTFGNSRKVNDGIPQNSHGDSIYGGEITDGHRTGGAFTMVDNRGDNLVGNVDGNVDNTPASSASGSVGYGRYRSDGHDNGSDPNHSKDTFGVKVDQGNIGTGTDVSPQNGGENRAGPGEDGSQNNGMIGQNGSQNGAINGQNNDRVDSEMDLEHGEKIDNDYKSISDAGIIDQNVSTRIGSDVKGSSQQDGKIINPVKVNDSGSSQEISDDEAKIRKGTRMNDSGFQTGGGSISGGVNGHVGAETVAGNFQKNGSNGPRLNNREGESSYNSFKKVGEMGRKARNEALSGNSGNVVGATSNDGIALKDGRINVGITGPRVGDGVNSIIMGKHSNNGDGDVEEGSIHDQPSRMVNVDQTALKGDRTGSDDETTDYTKGFSGTWAMRTKNNISQHDNITGVHVGGNSGSLWIQLGNSSGTHDHKWIWKWSKKNNITRYNGIVNDENSTIRNNQTGNGRNYRMAEGEKKDITEHLVTGRYNTALHRERIEHSQFNKSVTLKKIRGSGISIETLAKNGTTQHQILL